MGAPSTLSLPLQPPPHYNEQDGDEDRVATMDVVVVATAAAVAPLRQARTTMRTGEPSTLS
jgi:hypothetical protein